LTTLKNNKKINSKLIEIYHSDLEWGGSLSSLKDRKGTDLSILISNNVGKDIAWNNKTIIPIGIDTKHFSNQGPNNDLRKVFEDNKPIIGVVARLSPEKNISYVVKLAKNMQDFNFMIIGNGPEIHYLKRESDKIKNIIFIGHQNKINEYYKVFDAFLLTSNVEGTPFTIAEAMSSELCVFSTNVGAVSDLIEHGKTGFFLQLDIPTDTNTIRNNFDDIKVRKAAKEFVMANHNIDVCVEKFSNALNDLLRLDSDNSFVLDGEVL
jgi:glycosyltransferase involved in cell wall biosynthesis